MKIKNNILHYALMIVAILLFTACSIQPTIINEPITETTVTDIIEELPIEKEECNTPLDCEQIKCDSGLSFYQNCIGTESGIAYCTKENMDIKSFCKDSSEIECLSDNECTSDQKCAEGKCVKFSFSKGFFEDDQITESILKGQNYELRDEKLFTNEGKVNTGSFEYKLINAFRMLGYARLAYTDSINPNPSTVGLHKFQRQNNLPVSDSLDKETMQLILDKLNVKEQKNRELVENLPLIVTFVEAPLNEPAKEHVAALFAGFYNSLPDSIKHGYYSIDGFRIELLEMGGNLGDIMDESGTHELPVDEMIDVVLYSKNPYKFCSSFYYQQFSKMYGGSCESPVTYLSGVPPSDLERIETFIHEFGHGVSRNIKLSDENGSVIIADDKFGEISFSGTLLYLERKSGIQWKRQTDNYGEFVTGYAREGPSKNLDVGTLPYLTYTIHSEDFAESFTTYILAGNIFRERAKKNSYLQEKYNFLRDNVFEGVEYDTGSVDSYYKSQNKFGDKLPVHATDYFVEDPDFVWNYEFRHLN